MTIVTSSNISVIFGVSRFIGVTGIIGCYWNAWWNDSPTFLKQLVNYII